MRKFEETLERNKPYENSITDYSKVTYNVDSEEVFYYTETLKEDLKQAGYDDLHISLILEAIHHGDGAIHSRIKAN